MPVQLLPFPQYLHPAFGQTIGKLPVTRDGVGRLAPGTFTTSKDCFARLRIRRHRTDVTANGLCGLLPYQVFLDGTVAFHERTLTPRLVRQESLVRADAGALGKPVLLTVPSLANWWARNASALRDGGNTLKFCGNDNDYTLNDVALVANTPGGIPLDVPGPLVIADGHHRAETHARLGAAGVAGFGHVPVCLIGAEELHIGTFARLLAPEVSVATLAWLEANEEITELDAPLAPTGVGEWLLLFRGRYFRFHRRVRRGDATDVDWLNTVVLPPACGITDVRSDDRITFEPVHDPVDGRITDTFSPDHLVLIGFPLPRERFFAEVGAGRVLPPKSTRFEPRVPSGLVVWGGGG